MQSLAIEVAEEKEQPHQTRIPHTVRCCRAAMHRQFAQLVLVRTTRMNE